MAKTEQTAAPMGTGHAPGLGEAFSINLSSGQGTYVYQMPLPDGVAAHTPKLTLEYAHGAGHGAWGLGWRMGLRSISRRLDFGTPDESLVERFLDSGSEIVRVTDSSYRAVRESAFSRYENRNGGWRIEDRNGLVHELGTVPEARVADANHPERVIEWLLERTLDVSGNAIHYRYRRENGFAYLLTIRYAIYEVRFRYQDRPDRRWDGRAGFLRRRTLRCAGIDLFLDPGPAERRIRSWDFGYVLAEGSGVSLLSQVVLTSHGPTADGTGDVRRPPIQFQYTSFDPKQYRVQWMDSEGAPPPGLEEPDVALVSMDDAPLPGILINRGGSEYYWPNRGNGRWGMPQPVRSAPATASFARAGVAFVDMDGSGDADLLVTADDQGHGYYENRRRQGWGGFVAFPRNRRNSPPWTDPTLRLLDADGNGVVDAMTSQRRAFVWWRNGGRNGWDDPALIPKSDPDLLQVDLNDPDIHLADMTGDGLPDIVRVRSGSVEYWPNLGRGRFGQRILMRQAPRIRRTPNDALLLVDLDGDGCAELVHWFRDGLVICQNRNGEQFAEPVLIQGLPEPIAGTVRAMNLEGQAGAGLVWNSHTWQGPRYVQFSFRNAVPPYVLSLIENGAGLRSELSYRSAVEDYLRDREAGQSWTTHFPFPYLVVAGTKEIDLVSGRVSETRLKYHEAHFEGRTRQFQGFRRTERLDKGDESRPDSLQVHHFHMAEEQAPGHGPEHAALNGLLHRIEYFELDGSPQQERPSRIETSEHGLTLLEDAEEGSSPRSFVFVTMHRIEDSERTTDVRVEEKHYTYDANGNVVQERLRGSGTEAGIAQSVRERITDIAYAVSASRYLLGRPSHTTLRDPSGFLLAEKRFYYDGPDFVGLPLGQMERGLVSRVEEWVLTQADFDAHYAGLDQNVLGYTSDVNAEGVASVFAVRELTRYDGRGLAIAKRDPFGNETTMGYDLDGVFRLRLTDPLGESEFEYDRSTGQINRITYPDGAVGQFKYDAQGRLLHGLAPGEDPAKPATTHTYDESVIPNRRTVGLRQLDGTISNSVTYYDGYGKPFQQRAEVEPGHYVVSGWRRLNPWGDLKEEFEPTFADTAEFGPVETLGRPSRQIFYDARGRTVRCLNYNRGESTVSFEPFRVTTRDANDHDASPANVARGQFDTPHVEEFDVFRYLRRVTERVGVNRHVATAYEIGPMGELLAVSDTRGEKFRYRYDRLGNRLELTLREAGTRKLWYDAAKRLIRSLDGEGHDLRAQWDAIGRLQSLRSGAELLEEYTYDDGAQNAFGLLAAVQYPGGRQVFHYDEQRRLVRREHHHEGFATPVAIEHEYDPLGREIACTYDDQTRIEKRFSLNGWLVEIPGVITRVERDARGLPIEIKFANGVRTQCEYTAGPGRLRRQQTQGPNAEMLEDRLFALDQMEMILSSDDPSAGGSGPRSYAYDPLYQLTRVSSVENGLPVQRTYDYVNDYNLSRFDEARATLHYDDPQRPERLTSLTAEGGAQFDVDYDGDGNLLALPNQQFVYNAKNELFSFIRSDGLRADYRYDHHGLRVSKRVEGAGEGPEVIRYLGLGGEVQSRGDGSNELICHVRVGDRRVATLRAGAALFVHEDGLGSTAFVTDASGQVSGRVDHLPFGTVAGSVGTVEFRTYGLHPLDAESGLVYMRRRYYSPALGRFLTPDLMAIYQPEQLMHHPQHLHLYSYVANDPLNKTDPTGLSVWSVIGMVVGIAAGIAVGAALVALSGGLIGAFGIIGLLMASGIILGVSLGVAAICYTIAANLDSGSGAQEFFRGFMIGFNAGMNAAIASALFCPYAGIALGIIGAAAAIDRVASNHVYQGVLGWSSWAMPMSWTMTGLGVIAYVINGFAALISWNGDWWLSGAKIEDVSLDWRTGTFVMSGGLTSPSPSSRANGYNLGNFVILNPGLSDAEVEVVMRHETGHTLNTGAFGSGFELLTLIDEVVVNAGHEQDAYGEMIAESIVPGTDRPTIPMWS